MRKPPAILFLTLTIISLAYPRQRPGTPPAADQRAAQVLITFGVTVSDKSIKSPNLVGGLDKAAFTVYDNDIPQEIAFFAEGGAPLSVGIVYDLSGSMKPNRADAGKMNAGIRAGLAQFIRAGNASDEYFLMGFSKGVELLSDWTRDGESLPGKTEVARPKGQTAFYDACYAAAEKLGREARHRPVLVLISDCEDNASRRGFGEVRRALLEGMAQVYVVMPLRYASDGGGGSALYDACGDTRKLASETGGRVYDRGKTPGISEVGTYENIFEHMSLELRRQYTIGYKPSRPAEDGKWHRIKVVVKAAKDSSGKTPSLSVFSREGYLAKRGALNK